jgi:hypothetical protein
MSKIENELKSTINRANDRFNEDATVKRFQSIQSDFETLVAKGYAKKRGNNSLSVTDAHLKTRTVFNTK